MKTNNNDNELRLAVDDFINRWHSLFVLDYWWRKKYNVPFGSPEHRSMSFIDMYIEYREEKKIMALKKMEEEKEYSVGEPMTQEEIDEDYESIKI